MNSSQNTILSTINELFSSLFSSIDSSIYTALDDIVFINTNILDSTYLEKIFGTSASTRIFDDCKCTINWFYYIFFN